jgi:hypothetical protein
MRSVPFPGTVVVARVVVVVGAVDVVVAGVGSVVVAAIVGADVALAADPTVQALRAARTSSGR